MPTNSANILKSNKFKHKNLDYVVVAFIEPTNLLQVVVEVTHKGHPVVITYPDGFKATLGYHVDLGTAINMAATTGIQAVDELMRTAEDDIRRLV